MSDLLEMIQELKVSMAQTKRDLAKPPLPRRTGLFNVHKRSVPVSLDRIVACGLTGAEATALTAQLVKKEKKRREAEGYEDFSPKFVYDIVPVWPTEREASVFYNEGPLTI